MRRTVRICANQLLESEVIDVVSVELEGEFTQGVLLGDVSKSEFTAISEPPADVFITSVDLGNLPGGISNDRAGKTGLKINDFLGGKVPDQIALGNFVPVHIGGKTVGPTPPAMIRVGRTGAPDRADIVAIGRFGFEMRVPTNEIYDRNTGVAGLRIVDRRFCRDRSTEKIGLRRCRETFGIGCAKGQIIKWLIANCDLWFRGTAEIGILVIPLGQGQVEVP